MEITREAVMQAKGKELRGLYATVFGKPTANKNSTYIREKILEELRQRTHGAKASAAPKNGETETPAEAKNPTKAEAARESKRAAADKKVVHRMKDVEAGTKIEHTRRGKVLATCTYKGPREWVYDGETYTSASSAAVAAAKALKMKTTAYNGWVFWGIK